MRAFFALPIPTGTIEHIHNELTCIRESYATVKWVQPPAMHITLLFLGNIDDDLVRECKEVLRSPSLKIDPFTVKYRGVGCFPSNRRPRVFYVRIEQGFEQCVRIYDILKGLLPSSIRVESRKYTPHITIARIKKGGQTPALEDFPQLQGEFTVDRCVLFESILKPIGAEYREVAEARLE